MQVALVTAKPTRGTTPFTFKSPCEADERPSKPKGVYREEVQADPRLGQSADDRPGVLAVGCQKTFQEIEATV